MRVEEYNDKREVYILAGLITNDRVCGRIASKWDGRLFHHPVVNAIAAEVVSYYQKHQKAPGDDLFPLFRLWADKCPVPENVEVAERIMKNVNREWEQLGKEVPNPESLIDMAGEYFNHVRLDRLQKRIADCLRAKETAEAEQSVVNYRKLEMGVGSGEDLFNDEDLVFSIFKRQTDSLITYPGDVGRFFGPLFARDNLVCYLASEKGGKSYWLMDLAIRLIKRHLKVAFFEAGDDHDETRLRFMVRVAGHPARGYSSVWPFTFKWPVSISPPAKGPDGRLLGAAFVETKEKTFETHLEGFKAWQSCRRLTDEVIHSNLPFLKLSCHPSGTLTVADIQSVMEEWSQNGFTADAVIIDYADILAPLDRKVSELKQEDQTWMALRALSQQRHILVATATQATRQSYGQKWISKEHISGNKRKLAHVSACIGICRDRGEEDQQSCRLKWIVRRKGAGSGYVHVAGCLPLARPCVVSCF